MDLSLTTLCFGDNWLLRIRLDDKFEVTVFFFVFFFVSSPRHVLFLSRNGFMYKGPGTVNTSTQGMLRMFGTEFYAVSFINTLLHHWSNMIMKSQTIWSPSEFLWTSISS